jgi:acyl-CoA thioester hydrolase
MHLTIDASLLKFAIDVRVRWADTDAVGIAYNGAYLTWFEVARVEYSRAMLAWKLGVGIEDSRVQDHLFEGREAFTLASSTANWLEPSRVDARLRVATRISRIGKSSFDHLFRITRVADGAVVALGESTQVRVDPKTLRPTPLEAELRESMEGFERALASGEASFPPRSA